MIPLEWLFQALCPLSWTGLLNSNPNPNNNGTLVLKLRFISPWVTQIWNVWRQKCGCSAVIPLAWLLQPQCPWSLTISDSLNLNTNCNGILALLLRSLAQWRPRLEKWGGKKRWCHAVIPWHDFSSPSVYEAVGFLSLCTITLFEFSMWPDLVVM